jgi:8-oxo-dGTP pyrophosphatase MutT (NUDIX family)
MFLNQIRPSHSALGKVTAFVTRESERGRELLVFRHPSAGVQLPAGTVEPGETPEEAVLRELSEETGLTDVEIVRPLGLMTMDDEEIGLDDDEFLLLRTVSRMRYPGEPDVPRWRRIRRGQRVHVVAQQGEYVKIHYYRYQLLKGGDFDVMRCVSGWIEMDALTKNMNRYLYHLRTNRPTADTWEKRADHHHVFSMYWVPLNTDPKLVKGLGKWLVWARERNL